MYQDGKWNIGEESEEDKDDEEEEDGDSGEEEESEAEEEDGDGGEEEEEDEEGEQEGSSEEEEDGHSDLESEQGSEDEEREQEDEEASAKPSLSKEEMKAQQEAAKAELPYTFTGNYTQKQMNKLDPEKNTNIYSYLDFSFPLLPPLVAPESYGDLKALLQGHTPDNQRLIVARTQKSNHASLAVGNKLKLQVQHGVYISVNECGASVSVASFMLLSVPYEFTVFSLFGSETVWLSVGVCWRIGHQEST